MRIITSFVIATLIAFVTCSSTIADGGQRRINLSKDRTRTVVGGSVNHGERITYLVEARSGQEMEVHIVSLGNSAVVAIYEPQSEHAIRGTEEAQEVKHWKGRLPKSGDYRVVVGSTGGKTHYRLRFSLK
jgi:hypothetical protein